MKKLIITVIISIVIGVGAGWLIFGNHSLSKPENKGERKILYYRSPMDPNVTSKVPMKDQMGMDYVSVYTDEGSSGGERKIAYYRNSMNPKETSPVPKKDEKGMEYVPVYTDEVSSNAIKIDPATQQNIGVTMEPVKKMNLSRTIRTTANIAYDETKLYTISTKIMGYVEKLYVDYTGQIVKKGKPLLEIYSPDLVSTQEEYLQAIKYKNELTKNGSLLSQKGADQLVESAKRRLLYWDIPLSGIQALEKRGTPEKTMTIFSPADGIVTDKMVTNGQNIMSGMALYKIADLSTVWGIAQIYQYELPWIKLGDKVDLQLSYLPGKTFQNRITYIYPYLDADAKTVQVRIEIHNSGNYEFKPGMFADATIKSLLKLETAAVPNQAIIHTGTRDVAIIALGNGYFKPVNVTLGVRGDDGYVQIINGLSLGENIVTSSQFLIDSESNLTAAFNNMKQPESLSGSDTSDQHQKEMRDKSSSENKGMPNMQMDKKANGKMNVKNNVKNMSEDIIRKEPIDVKVIDKNKDGKIFQDIMDWNVISDKPGTCPICGMTLKEFTVQQAEKNLKEHGFKIK